jgi:hypothetical protein
MRPRFESADPTAVDHILIISLLPQSEASWVPVEKKFENLARIGMPVRDIKPAAYGLQEVYDSMFPNTETGRRRFVGVVEGTKILIDCSDPAIRQSPSQLANLCNYEFPFLDLKVEVQFGQSGLADWLKIYQQITALLLRFQENLS